MASVSAPPNSQPYIPLIQRLREQKYHPFPCYSASQDMTAAASSLEAMQEEIDELSEKVRIRDRLDAVAYRRWKDVLPGNPQRNLIGLVDALVKEVGSG